jgi:signal transduction histidine kinase
MPRRITGKWRPPLLLVLGGALGTVLAVPIVGLVALRLMVDQLGFRVSTVLISVVVVLITGVLAFLLWRLLLRPIQALTARAEAVAQGDFDDGPLAHYGTQELRDLGETVLGMAAVLHDRAATIRSFTDHVTHELTTPLTAIRGAAEVLESSDNIDAEDRRLATGILAASHRMHDLLGALRQVAASREATHRGNTTLDHHAVHLRREHPGLRIEIAGGNVPLGLGPSGMAIVLRHLLSNADNHAATRVSLTADTADGRSRLRVVDDGPGISAGNRERIFDPFFTTRRESGGTGMGLSIVRNLLRAHGGDIRLVDAASGTAFELRFGA